LFQDGQLKALIEVNGVGNSLFDVEGGRSSQQKQKKKEKKRENSYITIKKGL
jgi:hypothetical protein